MSALVLAAQARAQSPGPDAYSGLSWGDLAYYVGGGTNPVNSPIADGTLGTNVQAETATALAVDSMGNIYFAGSDAVVYIEYENTSTVPALLAAVTTNASPAVTPQLHGIYQIAGASGPSTNCLTEASPQTFCADNSSNALLATFGAIASMVVDANGDIYTTDGNTVAAVRRIHGAVSGNTVTTSVTTIVGTLNCPTASGFAGCPASSGTDGLGDGGPADAATLQYTTAIRLDAHGNLYISDGGNAVVRVVYMPGASAPPAILPTATQGSIYSVVGTPGVNTCPATCSDFAGPANSLYLYPYGVEVDGAGDLYVVDGIGDQIGIVYAGGTEPPLLKTLLGQTPPVTGNAYLLAGTLATPCSTAPCGDGGPATQAQISAQSMHVDSAGANLYFNDYADFTIRKIDTAGYISSVAGVENPSNVLGISTSIGVGGSVVNAEFVAATDFVFDPANNLYIADSQEIWTAPPAVPQTIANFPATATGTYGQSVTLDAVAENSAGTATGSAISYSYTVNGGSPTALTGTTLVLPGAGTVVVTASAAGGVENDVVYGPATSTETITVNKATLTVVANDISAVYGQPIAPLTASYMGFVNGDTASVLTGAPALSDGGITQGANAGAYTITASAGTLASPNYTFVFVSGTLQITGGTAQTITFNPLPNLTYGQARTITLAATLTPATPARAITYTLSPSSPATISGSTLTITGGGTITVTANQAGSNTLAAAAPVTQSFVVNPAPLTVTGPAVSLPFNTPITPADFPPPTITGFAAGDTQALVTGSATYTTTATGTPDAGSTFPINVALNTLALVPSAASSYTFVTPARPGTLTITPASQSLLVPQLNPLIYGGSDPVTATAIDSKGNATSLPVTITSSALAALNNHYHSVTEAPGGQATLNANVGVGIVTLTYTQAGNKNYSAATSVTQTVTIAPAPLQVVANSFTREFGAPNPTLTYYIGCPPLNGQAGGVTNCFVNNDSDVPSVVSGTPVLSVNADQTSQPGSYPITIAPGTLSAPNYTIVPVNGTLIITPAGSYSITPSTPTLTIAAGHAGQLTLTVTPTNYYQGTVTMSCGALPANVSCIFSPPSFTFTGLTNIVGGVNPAQGTLTVNTLGGRPVVGALTAPGTTLLPAALLLPGALAGWWMARRRRALSLKYAGIWPALGVLLLSVAALGITACGSSSTAGSQVAAPGTVNLTITATGTSAAGTGNVVQSLHVTVVIQ
ncbi:MAG TPA: MBG domain-containing protein [Acidobacteriaceae bacterium]